jgi:hypothetical protein
MKGPYTPQLDAELVHELYVKAKAQQVPMTVLTRDLLREALELPPPIQPPRVRRRRRRRARKTGPSTRQVAAVIAQVMIASGELDRLINAFGDLVQVCCRLAEGRKSNRKKILSVR